MGGSSLDFFASHSNLLSGNAHASSIGFSNAHFTENLFPYDRKKEYSKWDEGSQMMIFSS